MARTSDGGYVRMTRADCEAVDGLLKQGLSRKDISTRLGMSAGSVQRRVEWLRDNPPAKEKFAKARERALENKAQEQAKAKQPPDVKPSDFSTDRDETTTSKNPDGSMTVSNVNAKRIKTLDDLMEVAGVDRKQWRVTTWTANSYEMQKKGGTPLTLHQVKAHLEEVPTWSVKQAVPVTFDAPIVRRVSEVTRAMFIPDSQNGYKHDQRRNFLDPLHDRLAWDVVLQAAADAQPSVIHLLGDMVDVANLSTKFHRHPSVRYTTQPTIDELHWWLKRLRTACPESRIVYHCGNHEDRLDRMLMDQASEIVGLSRAGEDTPVMTWRYLLRLDDLKIECVDTYGDSTWEWDGVAEIPLRVHHGDVVRGGRGGTTRSVSNEAMYHEVFGHVHRAELNVRTIHGPKGPRYISALSPGCLCRLDGSVPGVTKQPDWQQGFGMASLIDGRVLMELVLIQDGYATRGDTTYVGQDHTETIAKDTGWGQFVQVDSRAATK